MSSLSMTRPGRGRCRGLQSPAHCVLMEKTCVHFSRLPCMNVAGEPWGAAELV
jgi:hypothetical protein